MATKPKESSSVGKEKKVPPSSSSHTTPTRSSTKLSSTSSSTPKPSSSSSSSSSSSPSSTSTEKPVPNYLKPTISSRPDEANLKPIKKHGADHHDPNQKATLNRRRSFDKPPSSSRVQSALVSPGPKERRTTGRSSSFSSKTTTTSSSSSSSSKPISDNNKPLRSPKPAKPQPTFAKSVKSTIPKKEASNASALNRIPKSPPDQSQTVVQNVEAKQEATDQSLVHEVAEVESEVKVCPEEPKPEDNDQHSGAVDGEVNSGDENEIKKSCDDVSTAISDEVKADIDDAGLEEKPADDTQLEGEDDQNKKNEESNESHTEEGSANEAKKDVEEDKANEIAVEETNVVKEDKNEGKTVVDNEKEKVACEASNVDKEEEKDVEEVKPEAEAEGSVKRQGKKDSAPAYNDVIEETASKLLEKRKNKVKALVGAFETVIDYESK